MTSASSDIPAQELWNSRLLEDRASLALKVLGVIAVMSFLLAVLPGAAPQASLATFARLLATAGLAALYLGGATALDRRRTWAIAAARPLLLVILVGGACAMAVAIQQQRFRVPFEILLAGWALFGTPIVRPGPAPDRRSAGVLAGTAACLVLGLAAPPVFGWGGYFDVRPADLRAELTADCGPASGDQPETLPISLDWSWAAGSPFPSGLDSVVIAWSGTDAEGRPLYGFGTLGPDTPGVTQGLQGEPSATMARELEEAADASWHWGIELSRQQLRPGHIEMTLDRARVSEGPSLLTLTATYIHVGVWQQVAATTSCSW